MMKQQRIYHNAIDHPVHAHYTTTHFENAFMYITHLELMIITYILKVLADIIIHWRDKRDVMIGKVSFLTVEYSYCSNYTFLVKTKKWTFNHQVCAKEGQNAYMEWDVNLYLCSRPFPITLLVVVTLNQGKLHPLLRVFSMCVCIAHPFSFFLLLYLVVGFFISFICCGGE